MGRITKRQLNISLPPGKSAFLWGSRQVGKSYWIENQFHQQPFHLIDLLQSDAFAEYSASPHLLRERWQEGYITVIDEVQKIPQLLDEVHWLISKRKAQFLLTGSSARKLKRSGANMLGGRAWRYEMGPLCYPEIENFRLKEILLSGLLPEHFLSPDPKQDLRAYLADYLRHEIAEEGLVRNLPAFANFLEVSAFSNGELINYTTIARDVGVSAKIIKEYFSILTDTLIGCELKAWTKTSKRRMIRSSKFYYFDVGIAQYLAKRQPVIGTPEFGHAFEHFIFMELSSYLRYRDPELPLHFWRTASQIEVDFILGDMDIAIEVKGKAKITSNDTKSLRQLMEEYQPRRSIIVSLEPQFRRLENGIEIIPYEDFLKQLWGDQL